MRTIRTRIAGVFAAAAIAALLVAPSAFAAQIIVGSPLSEKFTSLPIGGDNALTAANTALPEADANLRSPVNGTIVKWRITGAKGGPFRLRVLRPAGKGTYTGVGTSRPASNPQIPVALGLQTFTANLPIQTGDLIGLDNVDPADQIGTATTPGAGVSGWSPVLADGDTAAPFLSVGNKEWGFNATVEPTRFSFGKVKRNKHTGEAKLTVNAPGPGRILLFGKGLWTVKRFARDVGEVKLPIKAKGKARHKLNENGKRRVAAKVTFTFSPPVSADTDTRKLTLRKKR
jgi:hypothetical protein